MAVLGNHDHHGDRPQEVAAVLAAVGVTVLEGEAAVLDLHGTTVGVAGAKGIGGGYAGRRASDFGEPEMKAFMRHSRTCADGLRRALTDLAQAGTTLRIALTHYSPVPDTLVGEPPEIHPFLGSYFLAEAIGEIGADLAVHGHAHLGTEHGITAGGVRVRNVAMPVIVRAYAVYQLTPRPPGPQGVPFH